MTRLATSGKEPTEEPEEILPLVMPEGQHPVREQDIEQEALKVLYRLRDAGYSGYLVGGGVRDLYLGNRPKDFDISTNARPGQLRKLFRNSRTIGRRFRLVQVFFWVYTGKMINVSTSGELDSDEIEEIPDVYPPGHPTTEDEHIDNTKE